MLGDEKKNHFNTRARGLESENSYTAHARSVTEILHAPNDDFGAKIRAENRTCRDNDGRVLITSHDPSIPATRTRCAPDKSLESVSSSAVFFFCLFYHPRANRTFMFSIIRSMRATVSVYLPTYGLMTSSTERYERSRDNNTFFEITTIICVRLEDKIENPRSDGTNATDR